MQSCGQSRSPKWIKKTRSSTPQMATKYPGDFLEGQSNKWESQRGNCTSKAGRQCRRLRWLEHLSRMDHHRLPRQALTWEPEGFRRRGQVDGDRTRKMSSRKISGKWASAGTRLKRLRRTGGAGGIVSPNASLTRDEPGKATAGPWRRDALYWVPF